MIGRGGRRCRVLGIIDNPHTVIGRPFAYLHLLDHGFRQRIARELFIASSRLLGLRLLGLYPASVLLTPL